MNEEETGEGNGEEEGRNEGWVGRSPCLYCTCFLPHSVVIVRGEGNESAGKGNRGEEKD